MNCRNPGHSALSARSLPAISSLALPCACAIAADAGRALRIAGRKK